MTHSKTLISVLLATLVASSSVCAETLSGSRLTYSGLGPLKIGMTLRDADRAGLRIAVDEQFSEIDQCGLAKIVGYDDIQILFEDNRIARIELYSNTFMTFSGAKVGDSEDRVREIYGAGVHVEPHQYDPDGHYLTVTSRDRRFAIVFETDGKTVTDLRAGLIPAVQYVEHCL